LQNHATLHTCVQSLSTSIALWLLVQQSLEMLQMRLQVLDQALENGQLQVNVGAQVAVQALEGGEAVLFSHGRWVCKCRASCAGGMAGEGGRCERVWVVFSFLDDPGAGL
jgi:hypothetical protein